MESVHIDMVYFATEYNTSSLTPHFFNQILLHNILKFEKKNSFEVFLFFFTWDPVLLTQPPAGRGTLSLKDGPDGSAEVEEGPH